MTLRRVIGLVLFVILAIAGAVLKEQQPAKPASPSSGENAGQQQPAPPQKPVAKPSGTQRQTPEAAPASLPKRGGPGYILSLSWSPAFCASSDPNGESDQCETGARRGLVVHGLWPDTSREFCDTSEPRRISDDIARQVVRYMPSVGLARHEWEKHGSCSGLSQRDYFRATEQAWRNFHQPDLLAAAAREQRVERNRLLDAIAGANPGLPANAIALQCGKGGALKEIRVCLDSALSGRACPSDTRRSCSGTITILPPL